MFLSACAFASIAGAVGGATINTSPIQKAGIGSEMLPQADFAFDPADSGLPEAAPPDHYAMTTPAGRVEVAELSTRGLYAQQRFGWREASFEPPPPPEWPEPQGEWDRTAPESVRAYGEPEPAAPPAPAEPDAVTPRTIDVAAELAAAG
jgi:hypothetical protein